MILKYVSVFCRGPCLHVWDFLTGMQILKLCWTCWVAVGVEEKFVFKTRMGSWYKPIDADDDLCGNLSEMDKVIYLMITAWIKTFLIA